MKQEQVLLITGASSGIGKETALLAKQHNFKVYACARRTEQMQDLAQAGIEVLFLDLMIHGIKHRMHYLILLRVHL